MSGRVLQRRQLSIQLERSGVLGISHQEREHALECAGRLELALCNAQLQAHQLDQVSGLVVAQLELFARLSEPAGIDQLSDSTELRRQRRRSRSAGRVLCGHTDILAECSVQARGRPEFVDVRHGRSLTCT
jgi:hypothetical protein